MATPPPSLAVDARSIIRELYNMLTQEARWFNYLQVTIYTEKSYPEPYLRLLLEWSWKSITPARQMLTRIFEYHKVCHFTIPTCAYRQLAHHHEVRKIKFDGGTPLDFDYHTSAILSDLKLVHKAVTAVLNDLLALGTTFRAHLRSPDGIYIPFFAYGFFVQAEMKINKARAEVESVVKKSVLKEGAKSDPNVSSVLDTPARGTTTGEDVTKDEPRSIARCSTMEL